MEIVKYRWQNMGSGKGGNDRRINYEPKFLILVIDQKKRERYVSILFKVTKATDKDKNSDKTTWKIRGDELNPYSEKNSRELLKE